MTGRYIAFTVRPIDDPPPRPVEDAAVSEGLL